MKRTKYGTFAPWFDYHQLELWEIARRILEEEEMARSLDAEVRAIERRGDRSRWAKSRRRLRDGHRVWLKEMSGYYYHAVYGFSI